MSDIFGGLSKPIASTTATKTKPKPEKPQKTRVVPIPAPVTQVAPADNDPARQVLGTRDRAREHAFLLSLHPHTRDLLSRFDPPSLEWFSEQPRSLFLSKSSWLTEQQVIELERCLDTVGVAFRKEEEVSSA